jgi:hypothetical protein
MQMQVNAGKHWRQCALVVGRSLLVCSTEAAVGVALGGLTRPYLMQAHRAASGGSSIEQWTLERVVTTSSAVLAATVYVGLVIATIVTLLGALLRGGRWVAAAGRMAGPLWLRRAVLVTCGLGLAAPVTAAASPTTDHAHTACAGGCGSGVQPGPALLDGLHLPDLPVPSLASSARRKRAVVVVRPGDSLWLISRNLLPPSASDSDICREVHRLYAVNRVAIGTDPDLIHPGTELITPGGIR